MIVKREWSLRFQGVGYIVFAAKRGLVARVVGNLVIPNYS